MIHIPRQLLSVVFCLYWLCCICSAMQVGGGTDEDGNEEQASWTDYVLHFLTFFWKLVGACVPPTWVSLLTYASPLESRTLYFTRENWGDFIGFEYFMYISDVNQIEFKASVSVWTWYLGILTCKSTGVYHHAFKYLCLTICPT